MGGGRVPNLKQLGPDACVQKITHCKDGYCVTTADGKKRVFWERYLRFKTDASEDGLGKSTPAIMEAGCSEPAPMCSSRSLRKSAVFAGQR